MTKNFLEIKDVTFEASKVNKVRNVSFNIEKEGDIVCLIRTIWNWKNYNTKNYCWFN